MPEQKKKKETITSNIHSKNYDFYAFAFAVKTNVSFKRIH